MINITDRIEEILLSNSICSGFPEFQKYVKAVKIIRKFFNEIHPDIKVLLVGENKTDIQHVKAQSGYNGQFEKLIVDFRHNNYTDLDTYSLVENSVILLVSYYGNREISHEMNRRNIRFTSLYDIFVENNLSMTHNYYDFFQSSYFSQQSDEPSLDFSDFVGYYDTWYERKAYEIANQHKDENMVIYHGKRLIFYYYWFKDFVTGEKFALDFIGKGYDENNEISNCIRQTNELLFYIKNQLSEKSNQNMVMFWLDALNYGEEKEIDFFGEIDGNTISFENYYCVTPYTESALVNIYTGKKTVDDEGYKTNKINHANSPFLREFQKHGIKYLAGEHIEILDDEFKQNYSFSTFMPSSLRFWRAIETLLESNEPMCVLAKAICETHFPYLCPIRTGDELIWQMQAKKLDMDYYNSMNLQHKEALCYLSDQLRFYHDLLPQHITKIYFGDHGNHHGGKGFPWHSVLKITADKFNKKTVLGFFSAIHWYKLIDFLCSTDNTPIESLTSKYAEIQDIDYCNGFHIKRYISSGSDLSIFIGYKGIITENEFYRITNEGEESFFNTRPNNPIISPDRLNELRVMCPVAKININDDERFINTQMVYKIRENSRKRLAHQTKKNNDFIRNLVCSLKNKRIAFRGGGESALRILLLLYPDLCECVDYVIDIDFNCLAGKFGIKVITPEEATGFDLDAIIITSKKMKKYIESENYGNTEIIDIHEELVKAFGFSSDLEFWQIKVLPIDKEGVNLL